MNNTTANGLHLTINWASKAFIIIMSDSLSACKYISPWPSGRVLVIWLFVLSFRAVGCILWYHIVGEIHYSRNENGIFNYLAYFKWFSEYTIAMLWKRIVAYTPCSRLDLYTMRSDSVCNERCPITLSYWGEDLSFAQLGIFIILELRVLIWPSKRFDLIAIYSPVVSLYVSNRR